MIKIENDKTSAPAPRVVVVGEPVRPSSDFYPTAIAFRSVVEKLGLTNTSVVRELASNAIPVLERLLGKKISRDCLSVELVVSLRVVRSDGSVEIIEATAPKRKKDLGR